MSALSSDEQQVDKLTEFVRNKLGNAPGCHDFGHTSRVLHNALLLAEMEGIAAPGSLELIRVSALLHDIARPDELATNGKICHATYGADIVPGILEMFDYDDADFIEKVASIVLTHRFRGAHAPASIEEKIVFDADKLDSIGAIGLGRAFHFAGRVGAKVHNTEAEAVKGETYGSDDTAYREYLVKLRHIPERMMTMSGKRIAERRAVFMEKFFDLLNKEVFGSDF